MPTHSSSTQTRFRMRAALLPALFALLVCAGGRIACAQTVDQVAPQVKATGYVTDLAGVLSQSAREQLTALCTEVDQKTQAQIAVVAIKSLGGRTVDDYAVDLFTRAGIGAKATNRGVLILVAVDDHKYWITTGYGLEAILPDGRTGSFGREALTYFRANNYDTALLLMTRRVADVIAADRGVTLTADSADRHTPDYLFCIFLTQQYWARRQRRR
jgi:uncharacterized protein